MKTRRENTTKHYCLFISFLKINVLFTFNLYSFCLKNTIIVYDEAHNLEGVSENESSYELLIEDLLEV